MFFCQLPVTRHAEIGLISQMAYDAYFRPLNGMPTSPGLRLCESSLGRTQAKTDEALINTMLSTFPNFASSARSRR